MLACVCVRVVLGGLFASKRWVAYMSGVKVRALVLETVLFLLFLYHCSSYLWHLLRDPGCKISEKQWKKSHDWMKNVHLDVKAKEELLSNIICPDECLAFQQIC